MTKLIKTILFWNIFYIFVYLFFLMQNMDGIYMQDLIWPWINWKPDFELKEEFKDHWVKSLQFQFKVSPLHLLKICFVIFIKYLLQFDISFLTQL